MWFAQTPSPLPISVPLDIQTEVLNQTASAGMSIPNMVLLGLYFFICLCLIICVMAQTSKADGLMQQSMSAPTNQPSSGGKGKMSEDERLSKITTNLAYTFIFLSIFVAYFIRW